MGSPLNLSTVSMKPADFYCKFHRSQGEERSPPLTTRQSSPRSYVESKIPRMKWTEDLHNNFLRALEQLGGEERATPNMVFELMNVRGLEITHVKSHLQMYRTKSMKKEKKILGHVQETTSMNTLWEPVQLIGKESEVTRQGLYTSDVSNINDFGQPRFNYSTALSNFIKSTKPTSTGTSGPNIHPTITTQVAKEVMRKIVKERQQMLQGQVNTKMMHGLMNAGASTSKAPKNDSSLELTLG